MSKKSKNRTPIPNNNTFLLEKLVLYKIESTYPWIPFPKNIV